MIPEIDIDSYEETVFDLTPIGLSDTDLVIQRDISTLESPTLYIEIPGHKIENVLIITENQIIIHDFEDAEELLIVTQEQLETIKELIEAHRWKEPDVTQ